MIAAVLTCVLSDATRTTSPTLSPSTSGTLRTGRELCRPEGWGCCHLTSPEDRQIPQEVSLNVFTSIYSQTKKTVFFLFSTPGFIPDPKTCTLLRMYRCRQWKSEVITYSAVPLTSVFVNSWELVRMGHQAVPGSACVFVQTTLSPVELRFQRTLPQGLSICPVHC